MKIMFLRESEGVYQFGQRRVHIKVEKGNQPLVRVGGGYMHVKQFVDEFTQQEVERIGVWLRSRGGTSALRVGESVKLGGEVIETPIDAPKKKMPAALQAKLKAKQDKIEIPSSHFANNPSYDMKLKLHESSKGSFLTYEETYEITYTDYETQEIIYTGENSTNRYFFAELVGVNTKEKIEVDFVEAPFNPYEGVI